MIEYAAATREEWAPDLARAQDEFDRAVTHWMLVLHGLGGIVAYPARFPSRGPVTRLIRRRVADAATSEEADGDIGWVLADIVEFAQHFGLSTECIDEAYEDPC